MGLWVGMLMGGNPQMIFVMNIHEQYGNFGLGLKSVVLVQILAQWINWLNIERHREGKPHPLFEILFP